MTTVAETLAGRLDHLQAKFPETLYPPLVALVEALGPDTELSERSARFVVWFSDWDSSTYEMLIALLTDVRAAGPPGPGHADDPRVISSLRDDVVTSSRSDREAT